MRDDSSLWTDGFYPAPAGFDRSAFQQKIDRIVGLARGHSIIRVIWGAEEEMTVATEFTHLGTAEHVRVGRHRTRVRGVAGKVRKRRWIFEEFQPPEQVPQDRPYIQLGGAGGLYVPPSMVDEQKHGKWLELYIVADHSKCKPEICNSLEYFCFGDYREPDGSDLAKLRRITALRKKQANVPDPFQPVSQKHVNYFQKLANEEEDAKEKMEEDSKEELWADRRKVLKQHTTS